MLILAIDSSSQSGSVAFIRDGKILGEFFINDKLTHSVTLMPMLESLTSILNIQLADICAIAIAAGPGSFTGLRIGAASAKAMCLALNIPIIAVNTLDILAAAAPAGNQIICPILDARKNQVYTATYTTPTTRTSEYLAIELDDMLAKFTVENSQVYFVGDGLNVYRHKITEALGDAATFAPSFIEYTRASALAMIAETKYKNGETTNANTFAPIYIRKPQAELEHDN
ncbi:tRNA (adenosine(37)-N6)-threonylcarbamoyltransferase complex dimerization subunit type 1 TsaB [Candidatus Epulonipiscium viviparus]|uniref:tRNA (adenosine(37)-N6)-threonylcarbamoyltransferase complex dimerization subunit type 1 TsaB n=1 Tax=Candidatus Epulonipiscium viviparus TaxID=420336 RepID=UPI00016C0F31|nr:tRNA (adenosine(37)-N6)-threonylcarbamoyltransferase complex dimerization subunit type 1 TsaB [Candidatus Epulopiscium viviparus]